MAPVLSVENAHKSAHACALKKKVCFQLKHALRKRESFEQVNKQTDGQQHESSCYQFKIGIRTPSLPAFVSIVVVVETKIEKERK